MYLIINCQTKQFWQQKELALDDPIRENSNFLCFSAREIPLYKDKPLEMCFEVAANSLTGWDEVGIKDAVIDQLNEWKKSPEEIHEILDKMGMITQ